VLSALEFEILALVIASLVWYTVKHLVRASSYSASLSINEVQICLNVRRVMALQSVVLVLDLCISSDVPAFTASYTLCSPHHSASTGREMEPWRRP
jgi:hypothetical protein